MATKYTIETLSKYNIFDLRIILRDMGGTPMAMAKDALIKEIMKIQNKEITPKRSTRGRKAAVRAHTIDILDNKEDPTTEEKIEENKSAPSIINEMEINQDRSYPFDNIVEGEDPDHRYNRKAEVLVKDHADDGTDDTVCGVLEQHVDGYGFLRAQNYETNPGDTYVSAQTIKFFRLRKGDYVVGTAVRRQETGAASLSTIISVNGLAAFAPRRNFDDLIPCYPNERIALETPDITDNYTLRLTDLLCPIGKGQRGLIVSPPKAGKTTLLKKVAQAIEQNHPDIHLIVLLVDERPEEVTDFKRSVKGEVVYSTFDEPAEHHIRAAELVLWRAKRLVEIGKDVIILLDSITRLTRAYNQAVPSSGKILSGGIDPAALQSPKKFFGAARNIEEGGSLTILATALVDTGSKMDDVIYEEFKGTGNMEIHLLRSLAEKRIFPAIDLFRSGTRKDELQLSAKERDCAGQMRKFISGEDNVETLLDMIKRTESNEEFVDKFPAWVKLMEK